jgi:hypothetical protein
MMNSKKEIISSGNCVICKKIVNNLHANKICTHKICEACLNNKKRKKIDCKSCENEFENFYFNDDFNEFFDKNDKFMKSDCVTGKDDTIKRNEKRVIFNNVFISFLIYQKNKPKQQIP